jgi:hypothetical protein
MNRRTRTILLSSAAIVTSLFGAGQGFAIEPGDFNASLAGATMGTPLGAAPPPGLYFGLQTFVGPNATGTGQNSVAEGANGGHGVTPFGEAITPALVWAPGWNFLGGNPVFAVIQPLYTVGGLATEGPPGSTPPIAFANGSFFENVHNTIFASHLSWNLGNGWHASGGFNFQGPDGSTYNGTLNQDYWTFSPTFALAYLTKEWKITINSEYDIHTASAGHTGTYAALAAYDGLTSLAAIGDGYTSGQQLFIDWAAAYRVGKWSFGPAGDFKFQTTADTPGGGFTCADLVTKGLAAQGLGCGTATDISLGGMIGYDLGPAELEFYLVDSVYNRDDFDGIKAFINLSFKLWGPDVPPSKPMYTKGN